MCMPLASASRHVCSVGRPGRLVAGRLVGRWCCVGVFGRSVCVIIDTKSFSFRVKLSCGLTWLVV